MLNNYLQELEGYEPKKGDTMKCTICGRTVHLLNDGKGPLVCCGKSMKRATLPIHESITRVMPCRAAAHGMDIWKRRLMRAQTPEQKQTAKNFISKYRSKITKCKKLGLMI